MAKKKSKVVAKNKRNQKRASKRNNRSSNKKMPISLNSNSNLKNHSFEFTSSKLKVEDRSIQALEINPDFLNYEDDSYLSFDEALKDCSENKEVYYTFFPTDIRNGYVVGGELYWIRFDEGDEDCEQSEYSVSIVYMKDTFIDINYEGAGEEDYFDYEDIAESIPELKKARFYKVQSISESYLGSYMSWPLFEFCTGKKLKDFEIENFTEWINFQEGFQRFNKQGLA